MSLERGLALIMTSTSIQEPAATATTAQSLLPVVIETLLCSDSFDFDLFIQSPGKSTPVLYKARKVPLHRSDLEALLASGVDTLYIPADGLEEYQDHLRNNVLANKAVSPKTCIAALREVNRAVFLNAMNHGPIEKVVDVAGSLGNDFSGLVMAHEDTAQDLFSILKHDYSTYTHVTNVCIYAVMLAKHLSIQNTAELAAIATGALLHDIGKRKVSTNILNKQARLTDHEMRLIKQHPHTGFLDLAHRTDLKWSQLMMVFQHHERVDGRGYPVQIAGDEIDPWARICSIADVFDALTGSRTYHAPETVAKTMQYFSENAGKAFDPEMVACWFQSVLPTE